MKKADLQEIINEMDEDTELLFFVAPTVKRFNSVKDPSKLVMELLNEKGYIPQKTNLLYSTDKHFMIILGADCVQTSMSHFMEAANNKHVEITRKDDEIKY